MKAEEYLIRARQLNDLINSRLVLIAELRDMTQPGSTAFDNTRVSHSLNVTSLQDTIARIVDVEKEVDELVDQLVDMKDEMMRTILKLKNEKQQIVLIKRYLWFMSWKQIAEEMGFSRRYVLLIHSQALMEMEAVIPEKFF